jgi:N-acetylmuramoyl-L-alanine amidase
MGAVMRHRLADVLAGVLVLAAAAACGRAEESTVRIDALKQAPPPAPSGPADPLTVFLDAGHGGRDPGWGSYNFLPSGPYEKDLALDMAVRITAYLEAAGFHVVLSRTTDSDVNEPERDINGDGVMDVVDELQARIDLANASGAAVMLSLHWNGLGGSPLGGSAVLYNDVRDFADQNQRLAEVVQVAQLKALASVGYESRDWGALPENSFSAPAQSVIDTGYRYNTLIGPAGPYRPRPSQMPGAIAEPLYLTNPTELALARDPAVRDVLAQAYAQAVREFLRTTR